MTTTYTKTEELIQKIREKRDYYLKLGSIAQYEAYSDALDLILETTSIEMEEQVSAPLEYLCKDIGNFKYRMRLYIDGKEAEQYDLWLTDVNNEIDRVEALGYVKRKEDIDE